MGVALAAAAIVTVLTRTLLTFRENVRITEHMPTRSRSTDPLTGLGNRRKLIADLDQLDRAGVDSSQRLFVLYDLNGFKRYNDTFGHPAGDALLQQARRQARRCRRRAGSACYRLGGDEFCALGAVDDVSESSAFLTATTGGAERVERGLRGLDGVRLRVPARGGGRFLRGAPHRRPAALRPEVPDS